MRIASFSASKVGPFSAPFKMELDPQVTIVTGANDAGKTGVLRAIRLLFSNGGPSESDINRDHVVATYHPWQSDTAYTLGAEFDALTPSDVVGVSANNLTSRASGSIERILSPKKPATRVRVTAGNQNWDNSSVGNLQIRFPSIVALGFDEQSETIRSLIPLDGPNPVELALLKVAFETFNVEKFKALSPETWEEIISNAEDRLNEQASRVLPKSDFFRFRLRSATEGPTKLTVMLRDQQKAQTPFGFRGAGARKMISILARLLVEGRTMSHRVVLIDEPENSLHADAQHLLREFLFELCREGTTQVVYSTHSPSMINPLRPTQVRLVERKQIDGVATTVVVPRPEELGFASVRANWGLNPLDSLLYGPVTVIVEGPTEVSCVPLVCEKLAKAGTAGFEDQARLLGLCFFLDGVGANHRVVAKIAERQGTQVVVLLDGDNNAAELERRMLAEVPKSKVVLLPAGMEFEQLVPELQYFGALAAELGTNDAAQMHSRFTAWLANNGHVSRFAFTKKVSRWLENELPEKEAVLGKRKPDVMWKAVKETPVAEFQPGIVEACSHLLRAIREQLVASSFGR